MTDEDKGEESLPTAAEIGIMSDNMVHSFDNIHYQLVEEGDELVRQKDVVKTLNLVHKRNVPIPDETDDTDYWRGFTHALAFVMEKTCGKREIPVELDEVDSDE